MHLFIYTFIHLFIYSFIHLFIYSFIHLFIYSFIHLFIYSFIHLFIYSFIHSSCFYVLSVEDVQPITINLAIHCVSRGIVVIDRKEAEH